MDQQVLDEANDRVNGLRTMFIAQSSTKFALPPTVLDTAQEFTDTIKLFVKEANDVVTFIRSKIRLMGRRKEGCVDHEVSELEGLLFEASKFVKAFNFLASSFPDGIKLKEAMESLESAASMI